VCAASAAAGQLCAGSRALQKTVPSGNAQIRGWFRNSHIVITTTQRLAGAVHSVRWNGVEFIDSTDHGRQLQSACSFDNGQPGPFWAECFNPTEAGSRADGTGESSTSRLLSLSSTKDELRTLTQMAFWLAPGERSEGRPALNQTTLSNHKVAKHIRIGHNGIPNVLEYDVTFTVPPNEPHRYAQFEALTGYMPDVFGSFLRFDPMTGQLVPLSDGPGEQPYPVVLSTPDGGYAMGICSTEVPENKGGRPGYGRFRFVRERVVKWNCVFRVRREDGVPAGDYTYRMFVVLGTREDVRQALVKLQK
jgi:hypothetical protein